jgi:hypothetical protein
MSGSSIQALQRKLWEKHVQTNAKIDIPGAERSAVTDFRAQQFPSRRFRLAKGRVWRQHQPREAKHPMDVGLD